MAVIYNSPDYKNIHDRSIYNKEEFDFPTLIFVQSDIWPIPSHGITDIEITNGHRATHAPQE